MFTRVLDLIYPRVCPFCGEISKNGICRECSIKIVYIEEPCCMRCGKPLKVEEQEYCADCGRRESSITQGKGLWLHKHPVSKAIYRFKYNNKRSWGEVFAKELYENYKEQIKSWEIEEIIPIPLHPSKKRMRGYNQAEILAMKLSEYTGIPCQRNVLYRIQKTTAQKQLGREERGRNLKYAFGVSKLWHPVNNVLLIDDIYTTGATIESSARLLKKAGALNIYFLTLSIGQGI